MTREIKFRFWSPRMLKFYYSRMHGTISSERYSDKFGDSCPTQLPFVIEHFPCSTDYIQQFTGLEDKNNKEIFEGDIVYAKLNDSKYIVRFGVHQISDDFEGIDCCGFYLERPPFDTVESIGESAKQYLEVIGNIFENPELIKQT